MEHNQIVVFGAGKIGRSFIGQLFSRGGYEVIFIDISETVVHELNKRKSYPVIIKDEKEEILRIENVSGIHLSETGKIIQALLSTRLAAVCVGNAGVPEVAKIIALALSERINRKGSCPLDIILAENLRNAAGIFTQLLAQNLSAEFELDDKIGLIETSIGKMVPIMPPGLVSEDPLLIYAESYNDLIVDAKGFRNEIPQIKGLSPKQNMKAWVDRKLFIHNLGHAASAYFGNYYLPAKTYIWEVLEDDLIRKKVEDTMHEAGTVLRKIHPGEFTVEEINEHIDDLLKRFRNRALGDTIYRVGSDLKRKFDFDDRLVAPLRLAFQNKLPYRNILSALICGCAFNTSDFEGSQLEDDLSLKDDYIKKGIDFILAKYCKLNPQEFPGIFLQARNLKL